MFGFLKKFGKRNETAAAVIAAPAPAPVPAALATPTAARSARPVNGISKPTLTSSAGSLRPASRVASRPAPAPVLPEPVEPVAPPVPVPSAKAPPTVIVELSLKKLWTRLNPEIVRLASGPPDNEAMLRLPLPLLQAQLAKGAIKLPLVQFRQYSPAGLFPANPEKDAVEVDVPIADVIPLLKPEHFARRPNQRKVEVPDDIGMIFGPGMLHGLKVAEQKGRPPGTNGSSGAAAAAAANQNLAAIPDVFTFKKAPVAEPPAPAPVLPVAQPGISSKIPLPSVTAPTAKIPSKVPLPPAKPSAAVPPPSEEIPATLFKMAEPAQAPAPVAEAVASVLNTAPIAAPKLDPSLATLRPAPAKAAAAPASAPAPAPAAPKVPKPALPKAPAAPKASDPQTPEGNFTLALMDVAAYWSEKGRNDLQNLYRHTVEIPMSTLEKSLKSGRLLFQWREMRPWLRLAPGNGMPSLADELPIELPLSIIAPRFMEARGGVRAKDEVDLGDIPDVFEKRNVPVQNSAPTTPPLGAVAVPLEEAGSLSTSSKTGDTAFIKRTAGKQLLEFGEIFGQPDKKSWTLAEVAQKTLGLRGIAGAIIGTSDGLLVAGNWPGQKNEAVAAFVPQMYNKILQYSKELKIGEPSNFTLMIENVPLQIFKTGTNYLTVIGRPGENLPKAQLNAVATRLGTTNK